MLKRCQVLLADWMVEYLKLVAKKDDISFSEAVRLFVCEGFLRSVSDVFPKAKSKIDMGILKNLTKKGSNPESSIEIRHQSLSKLYFEARKIMEYTLPDLKKIVDIKE